MLEGLAEFIFFSEAINNQLIIKTLSYPGNKEKYMYFKLLTKKAHK